MIKLRPLSTKKVNWVKSVDQGIQVETDTSREKFNTGQKDNPYEFISFDFITQGWKEFISKRTATANDFDKTRGRSSFLMAFFSLLPFVQITDINGTTAIQLKKFKTDDLPNEQYQKVLDFLNEVIEGKYQPETLSKAVDGNLYRIKARARQDLRLLGLVDEHNSVNETLFNEYIHSKDRLHFLRGLIKSQDYFQMALSVLDIIRDLPKQEKRSILEEIGMLIVQNSQGENLMVESVAKERTLNLLKWLEQVKLIDENWIPVESYETKKQEKTMESKLREYF